MGSLVSILTVLGPLITQIGDIVSKAVLANATNDQATLDALHDQAHMMADFLKPPGQ